MQRKKTVIAIALFMLLFTAPAAWANVAEQALGMALYFDKDLSVFNNQACASCHIPAVGFDDPDTQFPVSEGAIDQVFGLRNAQSAAYAAFAPALHWDDAEELYIGGIFWDGRVDNLAQQAEGPPVNQLEMAMPDKNAVVARLAENPVYVFAFKALYGINLKRLATQQQVDKAYSKMAKAIGEFERTRIFNKFNSKFDYFLAGKVKLTEKEQKGFDLYTNEEEGGAKCSLCHPLSFTTDEKGRQIPPLLTDFSYDNLGIPINPEIAALPRPIPVLIDYGLGMNPKVLAEKRGPISETDDGRLLADDEAGKFKVMSLRNIAKTAPYGHNGFFKTLKEIVHFYNTRDVPEAGWPSPEVAQNVNTDELGNLGLSDEDEDAVVAFLETFTDGYRPLSPFGNVPVPPMP